MGGRNEAVKSQDHGSQWAAVTGRGREGGLGVDGSPSVSWSAGWLHDGLLYEDSPIRALVVNELFCTYFTPQKSVLKIKAK